MSLYITDENGKLHKLAGAGGGAGSEVIADSELNAQSENPVQNKVLYNPVNFAESERQKSLNLFSSDISLGWYNGANGRVSNSTVQGNTELIDVIPNETYYFSTTSNTNVQDIVFYKDNTSNYIGYSPIQKSSFSFKVPSGANKIGFNLNTGVLTGVMFTLGDQYEPYQPYNGAIVHEKDVADVDHCETIYDKSSTDSNINKGYTDGIQFGVNVSFSGANMHTKHKGWYFTVYIHGGNLRVYAPNVAIGSTTLTSRMVFACADQGVGAAIAYGSINLVNNGISSSGCSYYSLSSNKVVGCKNNANYYISKIEGVLV